MQLIRDIFAWYFSRRSVPYWCILIIDYAVLFVTTLIVYALDHGVTHTAGVFGPLCGKIALYMFFYLIGFRLFHTYSGVVRYSTFIDLQRVVAAMMVGLVGSLLARHLLADVHYLTPIVARDLIMSAAIGTVLLCGIRALVKYLYETIYPREDVERIFIYGVRQGGVAIAKSIRSQEPVRYDVVGFVTDMEDMIGRILMGSHVYFLDEKLPDIMRRARATALFVSPLRSEGFRENTEVIDLLIGAGIRIFMVPDEFQWDGHSKLNYHQLREVDIEDLLPRDKIEVDMEEISRQLHNRSILITGAAGSIGSEIVRQVAQFNPSQLILIDQAETPLHDIRLMMAHQYAHVDAHTIVADITNSHRMEEIFTHFRPEYVFHAAAYKHVPMMEDNPAESVHNNIDGTRIVADMAVKTGVKKFVMVSTDKAVNPTNVMGCSKRICEIYVQGYDKAIKEGRVQGVTQFVTTRFGNVLGSNGSVIPIFKEQIKNGGPITVTHPDIIRYFMLIPEACRLVLEAATMGKGGEIFVFDMGQPVKIIDLARRMIQLSGADIEIKITGLRDGEKLYEEVLNDSEKTLPTFHEKIRIAQVREYNYTDAKHQIMEMISASDTETDVQIVARMKHLVPEFKSQHSKYEALDRR